MRITAEAKERTRERILRAAGRLFRRRGFEAATTRDIARAAGVAAGTLFNYYPGKEDIARALAAAAMEEGRLAFLGRRRRGESLAEDLFALLASVLRAMEPWRPFAAVVLGPAFHPAVRDPGDEAAAARARHLDAVASLLASRGCAGAGDGLAMHLYWTLFTGVLAYWAGDRSPREEDTLALLDRSTRLFAAEVLHEDRDR